MHILTPVLKRAIEAASKEKARHHLNGVHIVAKGAKVRVEATDGHIAYIWAGDNESGEEIDVIVPTESIKHALKLAGRNADALSISAESVGTIKYNPVDGSFPDTSRVWPQETSGDRGYFAPMLLTRIMKSMGMRGGNLNINENGLSSPAVLVEEFGYWLIAPIRVVPPKPIDIRLIKESIYGSDNNA